MELPLQDRSQRQPFHQPLHLHLRHLPRHLLHVLPPQLVPRGVVCHQRQDRRQRRQHPRQRREGDGRTLHAPGGSRQRRWLHHRGRLCQQHLAAGPQPPGLWRRRVYGKECHAAQLHRPPLCRHHARRRRVSRRRRHRGALLRTHQSGERLRHAAGLRRCRVHRLRRLGAAQLHRAVCRAHRCRTGHLPRAIRVPRADALSHGCRPRQRLLTLCPIYRHRQLHQQCRGCRGVSLRGRHAQPLLGGQQQVRWPRRHLLWPPPRTHGRHLCAQRRHHLQHRGVGQRERREQRRAVCVLQGRLHDEEN